MRNFSKANGFIQKAAYDRIGPDEDSALDKAIPDKAVATSPSNEDLSRAAHAWEYWVDKKWPSPLHEAASSIYPGLPFGTLFNDGLLNYGMYSDEVRKILGSYPPVLPKRAVVPDIRKLGNGARKLLLLNYLNNTNLYHTIEKVRNDRGLPPVRKAYAPKQPM